MADLAFTGQAFFGDVVAELLSNFQRTFPAENLVMSGGCALNSSFNGQVVARIGYRSLYVPSAPADDGNAIGAAILAYRDDNPKASRPSEILSPYLGSGIRDDLLDRSVGFCGYRTQRLTGNEIAAAGARLLSEGKIIGWIQGRAEFGPRALGNRSILADPRREEMKDRINASVKFREEFRPFAPSILHEFGDEYFENYQESPYMERTLRFKESVRTKVPAVVHVDGTGRLQTVKAEWNPRFHALVSAFHKLTGVPVVLNTSYNVMGKPISHSIEDVFAVFATSGLDSLLIGDYLIQKP